MAKRGSHGVCIVSAKAAHLCLRQGLGHQHNKIESTCVQASLAARVRRLELAIPGLKEKLDPELDLRLEKGSFSRSTGHNILGRVEMLEDALELLLTAQVLDMTSHLI